MSNPEFPENNDALSESRVSVLWNGSSSSRSRDDAPPDFAEALSEVQAAVQADDAAAALAGCRRLVVAYDNLGKRVDDAAARALHALVEPVLGLVRRGV